MYILHVFYPLSSQMSLLPLKRTEAKSLSAIDSDDDNSLAIYFQIWLTSLLSFRSQLLQDTNP